MPVPMVSIVARASGTGKTTVMEQLISELIKLGYRVGAIKNDAYGFQLDQPGKDSWRFAQAGAKAIAIISSEKYAVIQQTPARRNLDEIGAMLQDVDIILIEGYKWGNKPKIEVIRGKTGEEIVSPLEDLVAVVTDATELELPVPVFSFDDINFLAEFVAAKYLKNKPPLAELTHFDVHGRAHMVDVSGKSVTQREAVARGEISLNSHTFALVKAGRMAKGDVLAVAQVAAIMGVKETSRLIPMCHPLFVSSVAVDFNLDEKEHKIEVTVKVKTSGQTGVEMEALTGVNMALLTIYDMCKAADKEMVIGNIRLLEKKGGRSGHFQREKT